MDAGRVHELDSKSTVKQALWALAAELGLVKSPDSPGHRAGRLRGGGGGGGGGGDRAAVGFRRRRELGS